MHRRLSVLLALAAVAATAWVAGAGDLNPPSAPAPSMRTLDEIYAAASDDPTFESNYPALSTDDLLYSPLPQVGDAFLEVLNVQGSTVTNGYEGWMKVISTQQEFVTDTRGEAIVGELRVLIDLDASMAQMLDLLRSQSPTDGALEWTVMTNNGSVPFARLDMANLRVETIRPIPESKLYEAVLQFPGGSYTTWTINSGGQVAQSQTLLP